MRFLIASVLIFSAVSIVTSQDKSNVQPSSEPKNPRIEHQNANSGGNDATQGVQQNFQSGTCLNVGGDCSVNTPATKEKKEKDHESARDWLYVIYVFATIIGVIGAWVLLRVVLRQTNALIDSERAWLVAEMEHKPLPDPGTEQTVRIPCFIRCFGKTPAWVTEQAKRCHLVNALNALPSQPQYENVIKSPADGSVLPPTAFIPDVHHLSASEHRAVMNGELFLYIYGFVKYRDISKRPHVTQYCFRYHPQLGGKDIAEVDFFIEGPPGYNKAT